MVIASNNKGKIKEIKEIFNIDIYSLKDKNINVEVEEDGETFYDNALKKAKEIYNIVKEPVIADDSGLCIKSLNDWPGVNTHRFLGENKSDIKRCTKILEHLQNETNREAIFKTVIVYYDGTQIITGIGELKGSIALEIRGQNGFGFDSIFELSNGKTLAELKACEKNEISARFLALKDLKEKLNITKK